MHPYDVEEADRLLHRPAPELVGRLQPGLVPLREVAQEQRGVVEAEALQRVRHVPSHSRPSSRSSAVCVSGIRTPRRTSVIATSGAMPTTTVRAPRSWAM